MPRSLCLVLPILFAAAACTKSADAPQPGDVPPSGRLDRDVPLARRLIAAGALVLDVRTPTEFAEGHLDAAVLVPVQEVTRRIAEIEQMTDGDKSQPIVVYCASGGRAGQAKELLLEAGFTSVTNAGGYAELRSGS